MRTAGGRPHGRAGEHSGGHPQPVSFKEKKSLSGKRLLITAGPTREPVDPVRYLSNRSSGKMGYSLAKQAVLMGAEVTMITGPVALPPPARVRTVPVETTAELSEAVLREFPQADGLIMAAAPADFTVKGRSDHKIERSAGILKLQLEPTVDILKQVAQIRKPGQVVVGFALETGPGLENARRKLADKKLDMIVVNSPSRVSGFDTDTNEVVLLQQGQEPQHWPLMSKDRVADRLLEKVAQLL